MRAERKAIVEAKDWEEPSYQTCRDAAWIAENFELSRRRDNLSFAHHNLHWNRLFPRGESKRQED
jgi:hypothetical protein